MAVAVDVGVDGYVISDEHDLQQKSKDQHCSHCYNVRANSAVYLWGFKRVLGTETEL